MKKIFLIIFSFLLINNCCTLQSKIFFICENELIGYEAKVAIELIRVLSDKFPKYFSQDNIVNFSFKDKYFYIENKFKLTNAIKTAFLNKDLPIICICYGPKSLILVNGVKEWLVYLNGLKNTEYKIDKIINLKKNNNNINNDHVINIDIPLGRKSCWYLCENKTMDTLNNFQEHLVDVINISLSMD